MDHYGIQRVDTEWAKSDYNHSPWHEYLGNDGGDFVDEIVGLYNVRTGTSMNRFLSLWVLCTYYM